MKPVDLPRAEDDDDAAEGTERDEGLDGDVDTVLDPGVDREHDDAAAAVAPGADGVATPGAVAEPADDATLAQWIGRIARQDERALESLYDATAARVNGVVLRIVQRAGLAEEVVEETYWQVWRQAARFDAERGRPITWLLAMARSRAIDALRREQRYQHEELPDDDVTEAAEGAAALPPQDLLEATRGHVRVHAALASLEPRARQLVALAFFRGLTHEDIAVQQGMPLGTVKSLIRRALLQLKRVMEAGHA
ncbi:MAG: sigma-70 family RNA polymerase sigma factor [Rubrivivax sp.]